jgi:hypothetical protein
MAVPLRYASSKNTVVRFYAQMVYNVLKFNTRICAQYKDNALEWRSVYKWIEIFKKGQTSVTGAEHSECPSTSTSNEKLEEARFMFLKDRTDPITETAQKKNVSQGSVYSVVYDSLGFHKVCARRVSMQVTAPNLSWMDFCSCHLEDYYNEELLHHYKLDNKQNMQWKHTSTVSKKFILRPLTGELMLMVVLDSQGPVCEHCRCGITVTSAWYSDMLQNELHPAICTTQRGKDCLRVLFFCYTTVHACILLPIQSPPSNT